MDQLLASGFDSAAGTFPSLLDTTDAAALGFAYLILLANVLVAAVSYAGSRALLLISPNSAARSYGLYMAVVLIFLMIITVLENQIRPIGTPALSYAAIPHLLLLCVLHLGIYYRQEPWLIALGAASIAGAIPLLILGNWLAHDLRLAHWIAAATAALLLGYLWLKSISTKRGFVNAKSIYARSKEQPLSHPVPQQPWLGLTQWVGLVSASLVLASLNELLRGLAPTQIGAVQVMLQALLLLGATTLICAIPATTYWLARRNWMPELTRFAWLVWLVVGFALTYGNYLTSAWRV